MSHYQSTLNELTAQPKKWLVTGAAGFIGSKVEDRIGRPLLSRES